MDGYWIVNVHRFAQKRDEVVAFGPDHAAAVRFAHAQEAAGNRATFWDMMASRAGPKSGDRSCAA